MPSVSVIIPTYNHAQFIEETLQSVFSQTFTDVEVIVVNDGSPDDTAARLEPYIAGGSVRYFEKENEGQAAARNFGFTKAKGSFIAFLDDDDLWPGDKLEWQYHTLKDTEYVAIGGSCGLIVEGKRHRKQDGEPERVLKHPDFFHGNPFVSPGQVLIKADAFRKTGGFDPSIWGADDLDLWMRLSLKGEILKTPKIALWYRKHPDNASNNRMRMLANSKKVIHKNAGLAPGSTRRKDIHNGYRWLYNYAGRRLILDAKQSLKELHWEKTAGSIFRFTKYFFPYFVLDPTLAGRVMTDWIPNRIKDRIANTGNTHD